MQRNQTCPLPGPLPSYTFGANCWHRVEPSAARDSPGDAVWQAFQGVLALWTVELRCRNSSTVWQRIQPSLQDDRQAAFHAIRLMELLWEDGEVIPAGWALTVKVRAVAHGIPSLVIICRCGGQPLILVCGICSPDVLVPLGIEHTMSALCEHAFFKLHPLINAKYVFYRDQIRKLLHIGQPSQRVLDLAKAKTETALSMWTRCPTAHEAKETAFSLAHFARFDECQHGPDAFPVKVVEMDQHWALSWSTVRQGNDVWWVTAADHSPEEGDLFTSAAAWYRATERGYSAKLEPRAHHWDNDLQGLAPARWGNADATECTLALCGHGGSHFVVPLQPVAPLEPGAAEPSTPVPEAALVTGVPPQQDPLCKLDLWAQWKPTTVQASVPFVEDVRVAEA